MGDLAFRPPLSAKLKVGLPALAQIFTQFSDQVSKVEDKGEYYTYTMDPCPVCWGCHSDRPICFAGMGVIEEGLHWVSGGKKFRIDEIDCVAAEAKFALTPFIKNPSANQDWGPACRSRFSS